MVNLEIFSEKLNDMFNGKGVDISPISDKYFFSVATSGFSLRNIYDDKSGKNFIPVFVSSLGGTFNPVPNLKEYEFNCQVEIFFPVRFKEDFYTGFTNFLLENFVAKKISFSNGEIALCNVGVPQYNEIETTSVREFQNFAVNTYKYPLVVSEQWMSMVFTIYLQGSNNILYLLANDVDYELYYKGNQIVNPIIQRADINYEATPSSEQLLGTKETKSIATTSVSTFSTTIVLENVKYNAFIHDILSGNFQNTDLTLSIKLFNYWERINLFATSVSIPIVLGNTIQMTVIFGKKLEV